MITPANERTIDTMEKPNKTQFTSEPNSISSQAYAEIKLLRNLLLHTQERPAKFWNPRSVVCYMGQDRNLSPSNRRYCI